MVAAPAQTTVEGEKQALSNLPPNNNRNIYM